MRSSFLHFIGLLTSLILIAATSSIAQPTFTAINKKDACNNTANGSFDILVTSANGAVSAFVFSSGPPIGPISLAVGVPTPITGLTGTAGGRNYLIVVSDDDGSNNSTTTIFLLPNISVTLASSTNVTSCSPPNGAIDINVTGGSGIYTYVWTGPGGFTDPGTQDISSVGAGNYSVTVTDANTNCAQVFGPVTLTVASPSITLGANPVVCTGVTSSSITVNGTTGSADEYQIDWSSGLSDVPFSPLGGSIPIVGIPAGSGTYNGTLFVRNSTTGCVSAGVAISVTVTAANTVSAASSTPTLCVNTALTNITHTTTGATGIGAATGLPAGVSASWAGNVITISGTPTGNGTFNYSIPLTGGCGTVNATGTITVAINTVSAASSTPTLCVNTALTNITHTTTGATGIGAATGLPAGVSASWAGNVITISGTPTGNGTFNYSIPLTGGCGSVSATGTITVTAANTAGPASSTPTLCVNTALTNITHTTTGATGIGAATGLPAGVSASWAGNVITISGTPTGNGTFNYSIPLTGGCGAVNATGTITVNLNTVSAASSTPTLCVNTALTNITHTTTGATGIGAATGLPAGVSASWAGNVIMISGTPTGNGTFNYSIPLTGGCGSVSATGTITVTAANTAGPASSTPTLCVNTALTNITHTTTGATGIGAATGLPAGVSASWAGNVITISGTPTGNGTFNYSIPLTGGCGSVSATGTITVTTANTVSAASSTPTLCVNTALTNITHTTTGATGIGAATGLPAGVSASWAGNVITISGTPTGNGTFNYSIPLTGGCGSVSATGTITVTADNTVSAASSTPTLCVNTALTNITHTTTGATGIGAATGLPAGVSASWAGNVIMISGTPTGNGTFNYSIPLTGGCGSVSATGTITVTAANTAGPASSTPTLCVNTALTNITHTTTGATGIGAATGLPAGVSASWAGNVITISGTPTGNGTFNYSIPLTGGCGSVSATGTITVTTANTVSAASSTPTLCVNTALTNITHTTTGATGIGAATGLPAGVSASWAGNVITISGTPTGNGTFNYSIPLTGGCGTVSATGTITVTTANTVSAASSTPTLCVNTALTNITHTTTGATGIGAATGLPAGVSASWAGNVITISGTPTGNGTFNYSIPLTGGCGSVSATGTITVTTANTAGPASSTPTLCVNTALTNITHTTTGATGIGAATGLPAGVSASWAGNVITISGTPTGNGTFNYSIPLTGGCGSVSATGTITVTADNTVGAASSTPTLCVNTALTNITHTTTGATGIGAATGLPAGVSASWAGNVITISGTPTGNGTFNYSIPLTGGCGSVSATGTITVTADNTVGAASSIPTLCVNTALTNITHTTTGATGIGAATGLPAGVSASWAGNVITISGTPTGNGTFNYSIPLTGGCGSVSATGTITVTADNTVSAASSTPTLCVNTPLTNITHTTTGATGIGAATGLPAGVSASWVSNTITISGTPTTDGAFNYSILLTGGCGTVNAIGTIIVNPILGDQTTFGTDTWIGYVYTDVGSTAPPTSNINFNTTKYRGFITETDIPGMGTSSSSYNTATDAFNLNLNNSAITGANLCGTYADDFSVRYKMTKNFAAGTYVFTVGSDDGVRLFVDGTSVLVATAFNAHSYVTFNSAAICLIAGNHDLEIQYYEHTGQSRLSFNYAATLFTAPAVAVSPSATVCVNGSFPQLTASTSDTNAAGFNWYSDAALTDLIATGPTFTPNATQLNVTTPGVTNFYVTSAYICGDGPSTTAAITVVNNPDITLAVTVPINPICINGTGEIRVASTQVGVSYQLRNDANNSLVGSAVAGTGGTISLFTNALSADATFNILASNGSCSAVQLTNKPTVNVGGTTINAGLAVSVVDGSVCSGSGTTIEVVNSEPTVTYQLRNDLDDSLIGAAIPGDGSTITFSTGILTNPPSSITFNIFASNGTCSVELTSRPTVNINVNPDISLAVDALATGTICIGGSTSITVDNSEIGVSYQLRNGTTAIGTPVAGDGNTINLPTGVLNANTTFNVLATSGVCASVQLTATKTINVNGVINTGLAVSAVDGSVCSGSGTTIEVVNSEPTVTYQLRNDLDDSLIGAAIPGDGSTITFSTGILTNPPSSITFNIFASNGTCSIELTSRPTVNINVNPNVSLAVDALATGTLCVGGSTSITVSNSEIGVNYQLRNGTTSILTPVAGDGGTINLPTDVLNISTTFNVLAISGVCAPVQLTATKTVNVSGVINAGLTVSPASGAVCSGTATTINISNSEIGVSYQLRNDANDALVGSAVGGSGGTISLSTGNLTGNTTFNVLASNSSCSIELTSTASVTVNTSPDATLVVSAQPSAVCSGTGTNIRVTNSQSGVSYQLRDNADNSTIGLPVAGTGSLIDLPTGNLTTGKVFNVFATVGTCSVQLTTTASVSILSATDPLCTTGGGGGCSVPNVSKVDAKCNGTDDGKIIINSVSGGTAPYEYSLNNGTAWTAIASFPFEIPNLAGNVSYSLLIRDNALCTSTINTVFIGYTTIIAGTITKTDATTCAGTDGKVTLDNITGGGTAPYSYVITGLTPGAISQTGAIGTLPFVVNNLTVGSYTVAIQDNGGCLSANTSITIGVPATCNGTGTCASVVITPTPSPATCTNSDGTINFVINPTTPLVNNTGVKITITGVSATNLTIARTNFNDPLFLALPKGKYDYSIEYGDPGCIKTGQVTIDQSGTIGTPVATNIVKPLCAGSATGALTLDVPGETGNSLEWIYDGLNPSVASNWKTFVAGSQITGIPAGGAPSFERVISVRKNSSDLCFGSVTVVIEDSALPLTVPYTITNATCNNNDGSIAIGTITGGTAPYTFKFNGVDFASLPANNTFSTLAGGTYVLTVTDVNLCSKDFSIDVIFPGLVTFAPPVVSQPTCTGSGYDGAVSVTITSTGTFRAGISKSATVPPTEFQNVVSTGNTTVAFSDLTNGLYFITLQSVGAQCPTVTSVTINSGPVPVDFEFTSTNILCFDSKGSVSLTNIKGNATLDYAYEIVSQGNTVQAGAITTLQTLDVVNLTNLDKGTYQIRLTQNQSSVTGCTTPISSPFKSFTLDGPSAALDTLYVNRAISLPDLPTGSMLIGIKESMQEPYEVKLELEEPLFPNQFYFMDYTQAARNPQSLKMELGVKNIYSGIYKLSLRDALGCEKTYEINLSVDTAISIPNIFTPNGDGVNDTFFIRNLPADSKLIISNRWGNEIYSSKGYANDWNGGDTANGVYFYRLSASGEVFTGWIEIQRGQ